MFLQDDHQIAVYLLNFEQNLPVYYIILKQMDF